MGSLAHMRSSFCLFSPYISLFVMMKSRSFISSTFAVKFFIYNCILISPDLSPLDKKTFFEECHRRENIPLITTTFFSEAKKKVARKKKGFKHLPPTLIAFFGCSHQLFSTLIKNNKCRHTSHNHQTFTELFTCFLFVFYLKRFHCSRTQIFLLFVCCAPK